MAAGIALYVIYRRADEAPLRRARDGPPQVLRAEQPRERDFGSILVPLFGAELDDDIVQTAALLVVRRTADEAAIDAATIEARVDLRVPMSLPLDARLPEAQLKHAAPGARAREGGRRGVHRRRGRDGDGADAARRARRSSTRRGAAASRRSCSAPRSRRAIRGGSRLGGRGGPLERLRRRRHQVRRAARRRCRVIVTAPAAQGRSPSRSPAGRIEAARPSSNLRRMGPQEQMFVLIVGAGRVGSAVAKSALAAGHEVSVLDEDPLSHERLDAGQSQSWEDAGGQFTVGTALEIDALIAGRHRARRRLHRLDRRRQHEPDHRPDRPEAVRRREDDRARDGPGARRLVRRAGPAHDLPDPARDRDVRARRSAPRSG